MDSQFGSAPVQRQCPGHPLRTMSSKPTDLEALQRENELLRSMLAANNIPLPAVSEGTSTTTARVSTATAVRSDPFATSRTVAVTTIAEAPHSTPTLDRLYDKDAGAEIPSVPTDTDATAGSTAAAAALVDGVWQETAIVDVPKDDWWVLVPSPNDIPRNAAAAAAAAAVEAAAWCTSTDSAAAGGKGAGTRTSEEILAELAAETTAAAGSNKGGGLPSGEGASSTSAPPSHLASCGIDENPYVLVDDDEFKEGLARFILDTLTTIPEARDLSEEEVRAALAIAMQQASNGGLQTGAAGGAGVRKMTIDLRAAVRAAASGKKQPVAHRGMVYSTLSWWGSLTRLWGWGALTYKLYKNPMCNQFLLTWAYRTASWAFFLLL